MEAVSVNQHTCLASLPAEVLEAYRLTFFIDNGDPISARIEKILAELDELRVEWPAEDSVEDPVTASDIPPLRNYSNINEYTTLDPDIATIHQVEKVVVPREPKPVEELVEKAVVPHAPEPAEEAVILSDPEAHNTAEPVPPITPESEQELTEESSSMHIVPKPPVVNVDTNLEFKITVPSVPASALAKQRKSQVTAMGKDNSPNTGRATSKQKRTGILGQFAQVLGFPADRRRGKAYYQAKSEAIQDEFQDKLAKLEKDYNEGYGLNLNDWDPETLCEEETAILLLNLMVNEVIAWQKETGRAKPETKQLVETLTEVGTRLRQTLKQTRGISTPSPTLFPDLLAENERDAEKIQSECDAYLHRFTKKLVEQERNTPRRLR